MTTTAIHTATYQPTTLTTGVDEVSFPAVQVTCSCGWRGLFRTRLDSAVNDYSAHLHYLTYQWQPQA
jgi:hypothetical protein